MTMPRKRLIGGGVSPRITFCANSRKVLMAHAPAFRDITVTSTADTLHSIAHVLQDGRQTITLVSLDLDAPVLDRSARATPVFELRGEFEQASLAQRHIGDDGHALAAPALRLPPQADDRCILLVRFLCHRSAPP